jgi:hypothetical protein
MTATMSATSTTAATGRTHTHTRTQQQPIGPFGNRIMAGLATLFNFAVLNFVLVLVCVPIITLPAALNAASVALDHWREDGEDRVVREFLITLRSASPLRTTACAGIPLAAVAIGVLEIRYFAHRGSVADHLGLGLSLAAVLITLTALGYVFQLMARRPELPAVELWSLCARLAARNVFVTGPLFLIEICGAAAVIMTDPGLLVLGVPILLLQFMRITALFGLRRAQAKEA